MRQRGSRDDMHIGSVKFQQQFDDVFMHTW